MFRLVIAASLVLAWAVAGHAEQPVRESPQLSPEAIAKAMAPAERRLSTLERWRGGPYLESDRERAAELQEMLIAKREQIRQRQQLLRGAELEPLRAEVLDRTLPPLRPLVSGF